MSTEPIRVILCWMSSNNENLNTISYGRPLATVRVYEKDKYDARVGQDLPFFDDASAAFGYMKSKPGVDGVCQVAVGKATQDLGYADGELDKEIARLGCR